LILPRGDKKMRKKRSLLNKTSINKLKSIEDIKKTLSEIARINFKEINNDTLIREELGIDSIMSIEIIASLEKKYNIKINERRIINMNKVGDFINYTTKLISQSN
jgi:acyl carrier protein